MTGFRITFAWDSDEGRPEEVAILRDAAMADERVALTIANRSARDYRVMSWESSIPERTASFVLVRHPPE